MTNQEIRRDAAQSFQGASIAMGLLADGLRQRIEPGALTDAVNAAVYQILDYLKRAGKSMAEMANRLRPAEEASP